MLTLLLAGLGLWQWQRVTRPDYLLERGQFELRFRVPDDAWNWLDSLERRGHQDHARLLRGEIAFRAGDFALALKLFSEVSQASTLHLDAVAWSGRCFLQMGLLLDAERAFQYALSIRPDFLDAHRGLAAVYYDLGAYPLASAHCKKWAELEPDSGAPYRFRGVMLRNLDQFADAASEFHDALNRELTPDVRAEVGVELAESLIKLNRFAEALTELNALSPRAGAEHVLRLRAEAMRGLNRGQEAATLLDQLLKREPDNVEILRLRAAVHMDDGQPAEAAALLKEAAEREPHNYRVRVQLAAAYSALGKVEAAQAERQQAKQLETAMLGLAEITRKLHEDPRNPALHTRMAELYGVLNMTQHATKARRLAEMLSGAPKQ